MNRTRIARSFRTSQSFYSFFSILAAATCLAATGAGAQSNTVNLPDHLHDPADTVVWEMRVPHYCEGPAWNPATGDVTFSQIGSPGNTNNRPDWMVWRINPGVDTGSMFYDKGQSNGQEIDPWGRLAVIQRDMVIGFDSTGAVDTLVKSGDNGVVFDGGLSSDQQAGNDLSFASNGAFYFTALHTRVFYVDTNGTLSVAHEGANWANGIHWIEEENAVYVHNQSNIYRFDREENGNLINRTVFANVSGMFADGGCIDAMGNRYVADYMNGMVRVFSPQGATVGNITMRSATGQYDARSGIAGNTSNCTFGGEDLRTLYITGDGGLYSLRLKVPGRERPAPPVTIARPHSNGAAPTGLRLLPETGRLRDVLGRSLPESGRAAPVKSLPASPK